MNDICRNCGLSTFRGPSGQCLFCHPQVRVRQARCDFCREPIEQNIAGNKRFCSSRCKDAAWRATDAGYSYHRRRNALRREQRTAA